MFERFTDRSRKVLQLANQEAQRLNHEYLGTEHLLIGLCKEGSGIASNVLKNLDINLSNLRMATERLVKAGPEKVIMGKLPQTGDVKRVLQHAIESAKELNHNYIGTEHLLLGLCKEKAGTAQQVLTELKINTEDVLEEIHFFLSTDKKSEEQKEKKENWKQVGGWDTTVSPVLPQYYCLNHEYENNGEEIRISSIFRSADSIIKKTKEEERQRWIKRFKKEEGIYKLHGNEEAVRTIQAMIKILEESE